MNDTTTAATDLLYEVRDGIGRITFNRPQARNALTFAMYERLAEICEAANSDDSLKVLILTGAGDKAFASGTDINQFRAFKTPEDAIAYESRIDRVLGQAGAVPRPDHRGDHRRLHRRRRRHRGLLRSARRHQNGQIRLSRSRARSATASRCRMSAGLPALIGPARVKDVIFTARMVGAEEAATIGLLTEVVEDLPALEKRADELAKLIAGHAPLTLRAIKEALRRLQHRLSREEGEDLILMCYMSNDFREGMDAFLNKRPPQWTGT